MADKRGCFKNCLFGCLGLFAFGLLFAGVTAFMAWRGLDESDVTDADLVAAETAAAGIGTVRPGRVVLNLSQGEFHILPGRPGDTVRVEARYDREAYELVDHVAVRPDSSWVYQVDFERTMAGLQAMFRALMGGGTDTWVKVYLPPDVPIELAVRIREGGFVGELGGLWITAADIDYGKGGFSLAVSEPLVEPMRSLSIEGSMGGFDAQWLGNASPASLSVRCRMGGADVDLRGDWRNDCDAAVAVRMGGLSLSLPRNMRLEHDLEEAPCLDEPTPEVPLPVMRLRTSAKMGEIDVVR